MVVTIDTDGQHDPADIPKLVEPILLGEADMVNGRLINRADLGHLYISGFRFT